MRSISSMQKRRADIVQELLSIRSLRPGNINEQYVRATRAGKPVTRGPYPVLCWREGKKVLSERLSTSEQLAQAQQDVANRKRFKKLCDELELLTRQMGEVERTQRAEQDAVKRRLKSPSNKTRKSGASSK